MDQWKDSQFDVVASDLERVTDAYYSLSESFDKWIITLAGGALGLTIALLKDVIGQGNASAVEYLVAGWIFLVLSIVVSLVGVLLSVLAHDRQRSIFISKMQDIVDGKEPVEPKNLLNKPIVFLSYGSVIAFVLGVIAIGIFAGYNVSKLNTDGDAPMADKKKIIKTTTTTDGDTSGSRFGTTGQGKPIRKPPTKPSGSGGSGSGGSSSGGSSSGGSGSGGSS
jgi:uncharacterized membrane protein YgcG